AIGGATERGPRRGRVRVAAVLLVTAALASASVPWRLRGAESAPPIHDVTTDTDDPPRFGALRGRRPGATTPVDYPGPAVAAQQRLGYPHIAPLPLAVAPRVALARAETAVRALGWTIAAVDTAAGRVEATDRTTWFGPHGDVVVRVSPAGRGSRVDVRSLSRVGGGDVGANAARIRKFMDRIQQS
ncbi:DUF1499 domain-containing protein, partial [Roseisolibacter sp. H3M3-2]|uniref:DUF1499 domain-containing protein n=1 Tax=Roseisolibacter sp. H3M3-2 TaxID=3031323 RepID=UPI0023DCD3EB